MASTDQVPEFRLFAQRPDAAARDEPHPAEIPFRHQIRRTLIATALFVSALTAAVFSHFIPELTTGAREFFLALTAAMAVHLLDRLWLFKDTSEALDGVKTKIVLNVADETRELINHLDQHTTGALREISGSIQKSIKSLHAMGQIGIIRVYENREEACEDIAQDLVHPNNHKIRLIGISLNDFVLQLTGNPRLGAAWNKIRSIVEHGASEDQALDIKILIIDPISLGAQLRSRAEERIDSHQAGRLKHDVNIVIEELLKLEENCKQNRIKFACRMYRTAPILALYLTDTVSYVQQYYFWSARVNAKSFPMIRFQNLQGSGGTRTIHQELEMHFDWLWEKASISLQEYRKEFSLGVDRGVSQTGLINLYTDPADGFMRMRHLLAKAEHGVSIQGVSLHSFFSRRSNPTLYPIIRSLLADGKVAIEVLFLKPDSEQAKFRAFREFLFDEPTLSKEEYFSDAHSTHTASTLYAETMASKAELSGIVRDLRKIKGADWQPKLRVGFYDSAPHCFLLRVDDTVLVEQYHYGKLGEKGEHGSRMILGKDLPLMEFKKNPPDLFEGNDRPAFALLESHFEFAMQQADIQEL